jgi:hypothetical protein
MSRFLALPSTLFAFALFAAGCGGGQAAGSSEPDSGSLADGGTHPSDAGTQLPDGGVVLPGGGTVLPDGGTLLPDGGVTAGTSTTMFLDSAAAQVTGRRGLDVHLTLTGHDSAKAIAGVMVRLLDGDGNPIAGFDSQQSGALDSELGPATLAAPVLGQATIATAATIEGMAARAPRIASVAVSLRDAQGFTSNEIVAAVTPQPVRQSGEGCDPDALLDRCAPTLGCRDNPATCQDGLAPTITRLAFQTGATGPIIRMAGTGPQDDLSGIHVDFEDASGNSITVPLDGDNAPPVASFDLDATGDSSNGTFLIALQQSPGFDTACPQIAVTPTDEAGHTGATTNAVPVAPLIRAAGAACDLQGFDACVAGQVCVARALPLGPTCQSLTTLQAARCSAAVHLAPSVGQPATTFGHTALPSLWDAPRGCSGFNPAGRPEGVAQLVLATTAATLTLSVDNPGTDFDTTLYLMKGCPSTSVAAVACDDDNGTIGVSSVIVLQNVAAGTYSVVVDSFKPHGGNYQLTATVE